MKKEARVKIETTNRANGMLESGGVCGRVLSYPVRCVVDALDFDANTTTNHDWSETIDGNTMIYPAGITLASWLEMYYPDDCKVIRRGTIIE